MIYGCIGEHLKHSFSKEIHNCLADYEYELCEISKDCLDAFMKHHDFRAINVTIPYKEAVIPYLDCVDKAAKEIGAVNTVVNKNGKLYGYNTDFYGMRMLISHAGIELQNKKVAVLGTGGTSKTARAVANSLSAREIVTVSRTKSTDTVTYEELYKNHQDLDVIINTTPLGMFPNNFTKPVDITNFPKLSGVIDAVYNPLKTALILDAQKHGIKAEGGLYMLVAQAVLASEIFLDKKYDKEKLDEVFEKIERQKENIILVGMPSSGKSTIGKEIAKRLGRAFYDTDELIAQKSAMTIPNIITSLGEEKFRELESDVVNEISKATGIIIATGGGVVLKDENIRVLSQNGRIYFLDRPLELLLPTKDRPLTSTKEALIKKYNERYGIYEKAADVKIDASGDVEAVTNAVIGGFLK
ncbi:MAG: shikimate dehydrogenase [Oscillospiraceae bacterium]|nr:shikimate dehydrogenase [Oscillospiraceae bacterium]